jgi:hypothetical protein
MTYERPFTEALAMTLPRVRFTVRQFITLARKFLTEAIGGAAKAIA